jgi:hypothetical protein
MDLDQAIREAFEDFALPVDVIYLEPLPAKAFCRTVVRRHGAPVASETILTRLLELHERGELPHTVTL